jgi:hypothetical protein
VKRQQSFPKSLVAACPTAERVPPGDSEGVDHLPFFEEFFHPRNFTGIFWSIVVDGDRKHDPVFAEHFGEFRVVFEKEPIGDQFQIGFRESGADKLQDIRQLGMERGFPAKDSESLWLDAIFPGIDPTGDGIKGDISLELVVGVVRTAFAMKVATVGNVDLQSGYVVNHALSMPVNKKPPVARGSR